MNELRVLGSQRASAVALACGAIGLAVVPVLSTFGELLTNAAMVAGLDEALGQWIAPLEGRLAHGVLALVGLRSWPDGALLAVSDGARSTAVYISWNCVGWQTLLFLGVSMVAGLQGAYTRSSRLGTALVGILGLVALNVMRIAVVAMVSLYLGRVAATVVHDQGTIISTVAYLMAYWTFAFRALLVPR